MGYGTARGVSVEVVESDNVKDFQNGLHTFLGNNPDLEILDITFASPEKPLDEGGKPSARFIAYVVYREKESSRVGRPR